MSDFDSTMAALAQRFLQRCADELPRLRQYLATGVDDDGIRLVVHRMAGSAGMFGYVRLGELATRLDDEMAVTLARTSPALPGLVATLEALLGGPHPARK